MLVFDECDFIDEESLIELHGDNVRMVVASAANNNFTLDLISTMSPFIGCRVDKMASATRRISRDMITISMRSSLIRKEFQFLPDAAMM